METKREEKTGQNGRRQLQGLPLMRTDVGGMDIGSETHWVCAPTQDGSGREIGDFGATTPELIRMAEWLKARQVESVAMESTGVYWIAPHEVLEAHGLQVLLVDTRQLAQVPGRDKKTDPTDCEWIQRLHSCGLLRGSFRPAEEICMLRTLVRDKATLVAEAGDWLRRMQKSLDQMNVRVHRAVSDISSERHQWNNGDGDYTRHRGRRARRQETGAPARSALSQKRGGNRRTVNRTLAGRSFVQPVPGVEDVRSDRGTDLRL
jgi:hypothetical protein